MKEGSQTKEKSGKLLFEKKKKKVLYSETSST